MKAFLFSGFSVRLFLCVCVTISLVSVATAGPATAETKPSILVTGNLGANVRFLVDPQFEKKLIQDGYHISSLVNEDLNQDRLKQFNTVILLQEVKQSDTRVGTEEIGRAHV